MSSLQPAGVKVVTFFHARGEKGWLGIIFLAWGGGRVARYYFSCLGWIIFLARGGKGLLAIFSCMRRERVAGDDFSCLGQAKLAGDYFSRLGRERMAGDYFSCSGRELIRNSLFPYILIRINMKLIISIYFIRN